MTLFSYKIQYPNTYPSYNSTTEKIEWVGVGFTVRPYNKALTPSEVTQNFDVLKGRYGL